LENPEKVKSEEIMKRFRLHFAILTRQRDEKIQVNSRKIKKSATSGKISEKKKKYGIS
jgi:hypothetical protein